MVLISVVDPDPDPDPYGSVSENVDLDPIWIRVAPKTNKNHAIKKSKLSVNILFT